MAQYTRLQVIEQMKESDSGDGGTPNTGTTTSTGSENKIRTTDAGKTWSTRQYSNRKNNGL